ncbi:MULTISPECIES: LacI family DNA-binding transcriptional regulator [Deinococcus]|uniref:LacI family DNA-binding transcriptional regulator n=1 Tax=Deinococcus rufus TaxID=2136097 RepID=A0ABV7Z312_9DEIO|nr:LacI family DNA-binding transcriptional regulator [Deinococcus sp. AB2017081]WQE95092.1 LacI family DNA-binding transcriptional regulator [Deinococcus sp. AB2017081]
MSASPARSRKRARTRNVTIHDVARQAGVSHQTVSRVINAHASVAQDTRERVLQAIQTLRYRPNIVAKTLATSRSQLIGMIAHGTEHYGPAQIAQNVERSARTHGYEVILATLNQFSSAEIAVAFRRLQQFGVDGVVMFTPYDAHALAPLLDTDLPTIVLDAAMSAGDATVSIDQVAGGVLAAQHLTTLGHRRVLHIGGPAMWSDAAMRAAGYRQVMERHGLTPLPVYEGDWTAISGYAATLAAVNSGLEFTAVMAANDQMALGAMRALRQLGRRVPHDVSVVGFDDVPEAAFFEPALTTVRQDFGLLGRRSLDELMRRMAHPERPARHLVFQPTLVERESTAPAHRSHA